MPNTDFWSALCTARPARWVGNLATVASQTQKLKEMALGGEDWLKTASTSDLDWVNSFAVQCFARLLFILVLPVPS